MNDVKRYGIHTQCVACGCMGGGWVPVPCAGGPFVEWHDYEILQSERDRAISLLRASLLPTTQPAGGQRYKAAVEKFLDEAAGKTEPT